MVADPRRKPWVGGHRNGESPEGDTSINVRSTFDFP
jgi:hypothetical protein